MALTIGNTIALVFIAIVLLILTVGIGCGIGAETDNAIYGMFAGAVVFIVSVGIFVGSMCAMNWYNTSTASGIRDYKDFQSEMDNGIEREIRITAEDGREIFYYEGKVDVESNHTDNYIKFESEDGKRYIVYYGIQDTITIIEK